MRATLTADVLPMVDGRANGAWLEKTTEQLQFPLHSANVRALSVWKYLKRMARPA